MYFWDLGTQLFQLAEKHGGAAAWLQAVGGLMAIGAAASIAVAEGARAKRAESREERRQLAADARELQRIRSLRITAIVLVALLARRLKVAEAAIRKSSDDGVHYLCSMYARDLAQIELQISSFPLFELYDSNSIDIFAQVRIAATTAANMFQHQAERPDNANAEFVADLVKTLVENVGKMEMMLRERVDA